MLAEIKMPSLAAALVVSILSSIVMYALGYSAMMVAEVLLILETLKYVVIAGFSALKAILLGIVTGTEERTRAEQAAAGTLGVKRIINWLLLPESEYMAIRSQVF